MFDHKGTLIKDYAGNKILKLNSFEKHSTPKIEFEGLHAGF
jgi:hypothetical protein